jgi:CheY-like chemotaxis protein
MNGIETAAQIRALLPDVPIVLFTMYDEAVGNALASEKGVNVVSKPRGGWKLLDCIHGMLRAA